MTDAIEFSIDGNVAEITIDRPEKRNALTVEMWRALAECTRRAEEADVRATVLTGAGDVFCAGDDITALRDVERESDVRRLTDALLACFDAIETSSRPVVGKANGSAHGGGFELLVACDLTVVPEDATFSLPEVQIGAYPLYGAKRLSRLVGRQRAMELALTGRELAAEQAVEWGLFARAVPDGDVDAVVDEWVSALAAGSPAAIETTKAWLNAGLESPGENTGIKTGLGYLYAGPDPVEGARSFLEGRDPDFAE
ncbi:MAG: enoyl-CoA hydratase/isomerase family protein [Haloarculaceae archaeon]